MAKQQEKFRATLSIPELAVLLGLDRSSAYELAGRGELPVPILRVGRKLMASRHEVERLLGETAVASLIDCQKDQTASAA